MRPLPTSLAAKIERGGGDLVVLVVRLGALGDILRTLPPVRLLKRAWPGAGIHWVLDDRWSAALQGHPDLDGLVGCPRRDWRQLAGSVTGWPGLLRSVRRFRARLRDLRADLLLDFHGNLRSGVTGWLSGAPVRLGYGGHQQKEGNRWFTTHRVSPGERRTPRMERNLDLIRALNVPDQPLPDGGLPPVAAGASIAGAIVEELAAPRGGYAVISPGASRAQARKKPPPDLLAAACRRLSRHDVAPLLVWGPGEEPDARRVLDLPESRAKLAPPTDLGTLDALLRRARLFVGGDSGPLHLACAVGCPVLGLYGPTDPRVNQPWGVPFAVVHPPGRAYTGIKRRDRVLGFQGLLAEHVERAVDDLLRRLS